MATATAFDDPIVHAQRRADLTEALDDLHVRYNDRHGTLFKLQGSRDRQEQLAVLAQPDNPVAAAEHRRIAASHRYRIHVARVRKEILALATVSELGLGREPTWEEREVLTRALDAALNGTTSGADA